MSRGNDDHKRVLAKIQRDFLLKLNDARPEKVGVRVFLEIESRVSTTVDQKLYAVNVVLVRTLHANIDYDVSGFGSD